MTKGQQKDLETIRFFIPTKYDGWCVYERKDYEEYGCLLETTGKRDIDGWPILRKYYQDENGKSPEECFFDVSDKGLLEIRCNNLKELNKLRWGKVWRGRHMEMYEEGILDASMPYCVLLGRDEKEIMPRLVVDFLKREMFKGVDSEIIERVYQEIIKGRKLMELIKRFLWKILRIVFKDQIYR